ncbi:MAG: DUF2914 domain-containing protein [Candidatus Polarisedimenticolia bacterium]
MRHHGLRLEDVARATGLGIEDIQALLRDDFSALPGEDVVRRGLQSFAWLVEVDPDQVLADFREERQRSAAASPRPEPPNLPKPSKPSMPSKAPARRAARIVVPALVVLTVAAAAFIFWPRASAPTKSGPAPAVALLRVPASEPARAPVTVKEPVKEPARIAPPLPAPPAPPSVPRESAPVLKPPIGASGVSVPEHGVGRRIARLELVGETSRFTEGERVYFWTRVQGGSAGQRIDHVWIHDGVEALRVPVRLGGVRWRAHSYKLMNARSAGSWAVEARDKTGRVLARSEFTCSVHPHR